jgi:hypothetical protein
MSEPQTSQNDWHPFHFALLIVGGLSLGTGIINLYYSFGWTGGDLNSNLRLVGFSGLDNIGALPDSSFAVPLVVIGGLCLILANANAWRHTDGY